MRNILKRDFRTTERFPVWFTISAAIILAGLIVILAFGFNLGIDFSKGSSVTVVAGSFMEENQENENYIKDGVTGILENYGIEVKLTQKSGSIETAGYDFRTNLTFDSSKSTADAALSEEEKFFELLNNQVKTEIEALLAAKGIDTDDAVTAAPIGATAAPGLIGYTFLALGIAVVLIFAYTAIRFKLPTALAAVIVLIHDVLITVALSAIFRIQINAPFIAAVMLIAGYSVYNAIVLFDRVRENSKLYKDEKTDTEVFNISLTEMINRILFTSFTLLIITAAFIIAGVPAIREFALPVLIGLVSATFSIVCIAGSMWVLLRKVGAKIKSKRKYKRQEGKKKEA